MVPDGSNRSSCLNQRSWKMRLPLIRFAAAFVFTALFVKADAFAQAHQA